MAGSPAQFQLEAVLVHAHRQTHSSFTEAFVSQGHDELLVHRLDQWVLLAGVDGVKKFNQQQADGFGQSLVGFRVLGAQGKQNRQSWDSLRMELLTRTVHNFKQNVADSLEQVHDLERTQLSAVI